MSDLNRYVLPDQGIVTEVFVPPSREASRLARAISWLVAPVDGRGNALSRAFGKVVVAPFTQMTFFSFDLQCFLFEIFHQKVWARLGHGIFMVVVNFAVMVGLSQFTLGAHPTAHGFSLFAPTLGHGYAAFLLAWYFILVAKTRLWGWYAATVPCVVALSVAANALYSSVFTVDAAQRTWWAPTPLAFNPWLWMMFGAFMVAFSHVPEDHLPPRVSETKRWILLRDYLRGADLGGSRAGRVAVRILLLPLNILWGTLDELWASPRLMPYNLLWLMFRAGYRPELWAQIRSHADRAWASGNPAIDYVGIGGGAFLDVRALAGSARD